MRMNISRLLHATRRRLSEERGFTMIIAMGVLMVTALLVAATFVALEQDAHLGQSDLNGKKAYYAARAGMNSYLYQLNQNSSYWQTCSNDSVSSWTTVPGNTTGQSYEYSPVPANGNSACNSSNIVNSMIDTNSGSLTMKFFGQSGQSGTADPPVQRGLVASFRRISPLDYLYYTVYEALDSSIGSTYSGCGVWYRVGTRPSQCNIYWASADTINGGMYTQDQFLVNTGASPTFGRNSSDKIATLAGSLCGNGCQNAVINGTIVTNYFDPEPNDNSGLLNDATSYGKVYSGITTIQLGTPSSTQATVTNCPSTCTTSVVDLTQYPIIYVQNNTGCSPAQYDPYNTSYPTSGCAGDVYVSGNYTTSATIAAANNIIVTGNVTTTTSGGVPTGNAVLGLVANQFVRVEHAESNRGDSIGSCGTEGTSINNPTIDAAIMSLQHSFIVDNFDCGTTHGTLTIYGALVQRFRGTVATSSSGTIVTGYAKNYNYDDRLKYLAPPYLFDILTSGWEISRETQCVPNGSSTATAC